MFVQAWVDVNALTIDQTTGVYVVDNRLVDGSTSEGSASLSTACSQGASICWTVAPVDPNAAADLSIQSIGNSNAWGASGQPEAWSGSSTTFTGVAQNAGSAPYDLVINANDTTVTVSLGINVSASS